MCLRGIHFTFHVVFALVPQESRLGLGQDLKHILAVTPGCRDVKLNVRHKFNGHIFEVQMQLLSFYLIKRESGHALYTWSRTLDLSCIVVPSDIMGTTSKERVKDMLHIAGRRCEEARRESGDRSLKAMTSKIHLAKIANIASDREIVKQTTLSLVEDLNHLQSASNSDIIEILLLAASTQCFDSAKTLNFCEQAVEKMKASLSEAEEEWDTTDVIMMARIREIMAFHAKLSAKTRDALDHYLVVYDVFQRLLSIDHPKMMGVKTEIGVCQIELGNREAGKQLLHEVFDTCTHEVKKSKACFALGWAYELEKNWFQALKFYTLSFNNRVQDLGKTHPAAGTALLAVGRCHLGAGDVAKARHDFQQAMDIFGQVLQANSNSLSMFYDNRRKQFEEAELGLQQCLSNARGVDESADDANGFVKTVEPENRHI